MPLLDQVTDPADIIPSIFHESQTSTASHRKLVNSLRGLQQKCASQYLNGDQEFTDAFLTCLNRILPVKKSEGCADLVIKFCILFFQFIQEKESVEGNVDGDGDEAMNSDIEEDGIPDTVESRFISNVLRHLIRGMDAKDKCVRLRACQLIAGTINCLAEIEDDIFELLKQNLARRLRDKEPSVRVQAVIATARLQGEDDNDGRQVTKALLELLQHDPSAEVRRAVLFNLEETRNTLPFILERSRDQDAINRRCIYAKTMTHVSDFRLLTIGNREKILRWGLKDRDAQVRKSAAKMLSKVWLAQSNNNILELLERLDVLNSKIAEDALKVFFEQKPEVLETFQFEDIYWESLTPESAFLARCFSEFLISKDNQAAADEKMPEVSKLAFIVQNLINSYFEAENESLQQELEFTVEQLLIIAGHMDFGDEIGRRQIYSLLRKILILGELPNSLVTRAIYVLRRVSASERDFSQIILEIISDLHDLTDLESDSEVDGGVGNDSFQTVESRSSALQLGISPAAARLKSVNNDRVYEDAGDDIAMRRMMIDLKCLHVAQGMLENVQEDIKSNTHLANCLNSLIIPSVRSHDGLVREKGLHCLGLCCLLDQSLALENIPLFIHCFTRGHNLLQISALHTLADIAMIYSTTTLEEAGLNVKSFQSIFIKAVEMDDEPDVQTAAIIALAKLLLSSNLKDGFLLQKLVMLYFLPSSEQNQTIRQTLAYFLPVYCHSSAENQLNFCKIAIDSLHDLVREFSELEEDEYMVSPTQISLHLIDWTDPRKLVKINMTNTTEEPNSNTHLLLAKDILKEILTSRNKDEHKLLCSMLNKLFITFNTDSEERQVVLQLAKDITETTAKVPDATCRNTLDKLIASLSRAQGTDNTLHNAQITHVASA